MAYTGELPYRGIDGNGRHPKRQQPIEIYPGVHPALVDKETFQLVEAIRNTFGYNPRSRNGKDARVYPLTGVLKCSSCGGNMRGESSEQYRYYQDASRIDRVVHCRQASVRAEQIEAQVFDLFFECVAWANGDRSLEAIQAQLSEAEDRLNRAKELYLYGELSRDDFEQEKQRYEKVKQELRNDNLDAIITFDSYFQGQFSSWDALSQTDKKRLLRFALESAWLRELELVAIQPTIAFLPLLGDGFCSCVVTACPPRSYNFFLR